MTTIAQIEKFLNSSPIDIKHLGQPLPSYKDSYPIKVNGLTKNYSLFQLAGMQGKEEHLKALPWSKEDKKAAVRANNYCGIVEAAKEGHLTTLQYLLEEAGLNVAISANRYCAIRRAAEKRHLATLRYLLEYPSLSSDEQKKAISAVDYGAIGYTAANGHLATLQYLLEETGLRRAEQKEAISANRYFAIRWTARKGHLVTLQYLLEHPSLNLAEKNKR